MNLKIKKLDPRAVTPTYGSDFSAGADLYALCDDEISVHGGDTVMIHTGIALEIPEGYCGLILARSGLASRKSLAPANKVGLIDSDYRGEIIVALHNHGNISRSIAVGERIAQLVILPYIKADFLECEELSATDRGAGGFGSTGK